MYIFFCLEKKNVCEKMAEWYCKGRNGRIMNGRGRMVLRAYYMQRAVLNACIVGWYNEYRRGVVLKDGRAVL